MSTTTAICHQRDTFSCPAGLAGKTPTPVPDGYAFNDYLAAQNSRLYMDGLDLAQLLKDYGNDQGFGQDPAQPLWKSSICP